MIVFPGNFILRYIRCGAKKGEEEEEEGRRMRERERFGIISTARSDRESQKRLIREKDRAKGKLICIRETVLSCVRM